MQAGEKNMANFRSHFTHLKLRGMNDDICHFYTLKIVYKLS